MLLSPVSLSKEEQDNEPETLRPEQGTASLFIPKKKKIKIMFLRKFWTLRGLSITNEIVENFFSTLNFLQIFVPLHKYMYTHPFWLRRTAHTIIWSKFFYIILY